MKAKNFLFFILSIFAASVLMNENSFSQDKKFPRWAKGIVWYQIFPERFANSDYTNDPDPGKVFINQKEIPEGWNITPWTSNWFAKSEWEEKLGGPIRRYFTSRRYGGDIQGIIDKLDYLKQLGINGIYINPIFDAVSMHKYDGSTFHHIDIHFGPDPEGDRKLIDTETPDDPNTWVWTSADKLFLKLIGEVHKRNMYIIIDGVFNHTGEQFWAFKDIVKNGKDSKYSDWFLIERWDDPATPENEFDYKGWWGHKSLPEFNRTETDLHPGVKKYIFDATARWLDPNVDSDFSDGIDGWRLDVARDVPLGFWRDWNKNVKSINPCALIIGELWEISSDFISEDGVFDALMNYNFAFAVNKFFIAQKEKIKTSEFIALLKEIDKSYPERNLHLLQNLLTSHDTERLSSMILNPDRKYDADSDERNTSYNPGKPEKEVYDFQKLIAAFQMTYRGAPMIYYGDEIGMWGADDPHCRKPMIWSDLKYDDEVIDETSGFKKGRGIYSVEQNSELFEFYKKLIAVRNKSEALLYGDVKFIHQSDENNTFAFNRKHESEEYIVLFNIDKKEHSIGFKSQKKELKDALTGEVIKKTKSKFEIQLPAESFRIFY